MTNWDKNGAKVLHEVLLDHGVEYVIGMDSPEPFYEVVAREKQKIKPIQKLIDMNRIQVIQ